MSIDSDPIYQPFASDPAALENNALKRQMAEARMKLNTAHLSEQPETLTPEAIRHLLHELGVHQIELEMQNEELRESQIALDAVRARYFDLYDLAPVGYFAVSERGLICQVNLSAANALGLVRRELHSQHLSKFILPQDQDIYYLHKKRLLDNGELQSCELRMQKADNSVFWAQLSMTAAHDADGEIELRVVLSDISERKQLQQSLVAKNAELEQAVICADKANQAKSEFLSRMSHDLRTPLNAILGFGQLLASSPDDETSQLSSAQKQSVDQILKAGWHLLELIDEVLDLAVKEAAKAQPAD
jgi:PAS domain S-box-containing protein